MIRLLVWFGVACVVLLAAVGGSPVMAAEAQPTAGAAEEATLAQAELEVRKAELRARYAAEAASEAQRKYEEGLMSESELRAAMMEVEEAELAVEQARLCLMAAQLAAVELESRRISVDVENAPLDKALRLIFRSTPYSFVLSPEIGRLSLDPLSIRLKEVDLQTALRVICDTYDLLYKKEDSIYHFFPRSDVVTIGGRRVPVFGAVEVAQYPEVSVTGPTDEVVRSMIVRTAGGGASEARARVLLAKLGGFGEFVDLEVGNATLAEVAEKLSVPRTDGPGWLTKIVVHPAVPEDIRVTAKVYQMRRDELVLTLAEQANLDVNVAAPEKTGAEMVYLVPKLVLRVYGTGVGRPWETRGLAGTVDSSVLETLKQWEAETGESIASFGLRLCPACHQGMMMHWVFCPHCGTKLPCDEEVGAEAK